jgi:3-oxoacyl-[acyl-carrier protein] reductase
VTREPDVRELVAQTVGTFGRIDVLVNNAGIGVFAPVAELAVADFDAMWSVNIRGVFLATREVLPHMKRRKSGDILNIASLAGRNAFTGGAGYCATKWALIGFARCLLLEVREDNIRVITICPFRRHRLRRPVGPEEIAGDPAGRRYRRSPSTRPTCRKSWVSEIDVRRPIRGSSVEISASIGSETRFSVPADHQVRTADPGRRC